MKEWELAEAESSTLPALTEIPGALIAMNTTALDPFSIDTATVRNAIAGDHQAFTQLFYQTYRYVFAIVSVSLSSDEDIWDAIQDTYIRVYAGLYRLHAPEAFLSWLRVIAQNCALSIRRRNESDPLRLPFKEEQPSPSTEPFMSETALDVKTILRSIPEEQAKLLVLVYYDGMKLSEVARMLELPASTVRSRFKRAKKTLLAALKQKGIDRSVYGRSGWMTTLATAMRDAVGTEILSTVAAQDVLDTVLSKSEQKPLDHVVAKLSKQQRNAAVLRIASLVVALSVLASGVTVLLLRGRMPAVETRMPVVGGTTTGTAMSFATTTTTFAAVPKTTRATVSGSSGSSSVTTQPTTVAATTAAASGTVEAADETTASPTPATTASTAPLTTTQPTFVSDYAPGKANTLGNEPNNLSCGGMIAKQDDWLYYRSGEQYLYKMKTDGTEKQLLYTGGIHHINVVGDWIYFLDSGIHRIRTDGSKHEFFNTTEANWLAVYGDVLYFGIADGTLFRMNRISRQKTTLTDGGWNQVLLTADRKLFVVNHKGLRCYDDTKSTWVQLNEDVEHILKAEGSQLLCAYDDLEEGTNYLRGHIGKYDYEQQVFVDIFTDFDVIYAYHGDEGRIPTFYTPYQGGLFGNETYAYAIQTKTKVDRSLPAFQGFYNFGDQYLYWHNQYGQLCRSAADGSWVEAFDR